MINLSLPNIVSLVRVLLSPFFLVFLISDDVVFVQLALLLFAVGAFTDYLDGFLARKMKLTSNLGKFLDPLADKVLILSAFVAFYIMEIIPFWALSIFIVRDVFTTLMRILADGRGYNMKTSGNAKAKTFFQMGFIIFILLLVSGEVNADNTDDVLLYQQALESNWVTYTMYILLAYTVFTLIDYLIANKTLFTSSVRDR